MTPSSYPQVQAPIVNNPAFWERLCLDTLGTDSLFFAFYYQQVLLAFCYTPSYSLYHDMVGYLQHILKHNTLCRILISNIWLLKS